MSKIRNNLYKLSNGKSAIRTHFQTRKSLEPTFTKSDIPISENTDKTRGTNNSVADSDK